MNAGRSLLDAACTLRLLWIAVSVPGEEEVDIVMTVLTASSASSA